MENDAKVSKDQWANNQLPLLSRVYIGDVLRDIACNIVGAIQGFFK